MGLRDKLKTCEKLTSEGVWFDILETGASFKCKRFHPHNSESWMAFETTMKDFFVEPTDDKPSGEYELGSEEAEEAMRTLWANHFIVDWQNITPYDIHGEGHPDDVDAEYSPEDCVELLREFPEVFVAISDNANNRENYLLSLRKKQAGN